MESDGHMLVVKRLAAAFLAGGVGLFLLTRARQFCDLKADAARRHRERWPILKKFSLYDPENFRSPFDVFMVRVFGVLWLLAACLIAILTLFGSK